MQYSDEAQSWENWRKTLTPEDNEWFIQIFLKMKCCLVIQK